MRTHRLKLITSGLAVAAMIGLAGCSAITGESDSPSGENPDGGTSDCAVNDEIRGMLPQDVLDKGELLAVVSAASPPSAYVEDENSGEIVGTMPELMAGVSCLFGVDVKVEHVDFGAIMPGVEAHRYDWGMLVGDFVERQESFDFIDIFRNGLNILIPIDNPLGIESYEDFCGIRVGVLEGSYHETRIGAMNDDCLSSGQDAIDINTYADQNSAVLALSSDRIDAIFADNPPTQYRVAQAPDEFAATGVFDLGAPNALVFAKDRTDIRDAVQAALQLMWDDGDYQAIFAERGMDSVIVEPVINGSTFSLDG